MLSLRATLAVILVSYTLQSGDEPLIPSSSALFYVYALISFGLSCFAGVCSGLTVGYMSISKTEMQIWVNSDSEYERQVAKPILEILNNHHLLLSTLLLSNSLALEALPIFLDKIVPSYLAIIISTVAVVVFGEVLPQAYCTGQHKVSIGYYFAPFIRVLQVVLWVFVRPITYVLDNWLGHHDDKIVLSPENLRSILYLHDSKQYGYRPEEIKILQNTMDLRLKKIKNYMIALDSVFMVSEDSAVDQDFLNNLQKYNYSKVPVYSKFRSNVVGYIKLKNLLVFKFTASKSLKASGVILPVQKLNENLTLLDAIDQLKKRHINFGVVIDEQSSNKATGIITLKKIFEKLVLREFQDDDNQMQFNWTQQQPDRIEEGREQD
jgi:metal transporter CNNM